MKVRPAGFLAPEAQRTGFGSAPFDGGTISGSSLFPFLFTPAEPGGTAPSGAAASSYTGASGPERPGGPAAVLFPPF
eukprot:1104756-Amphidinium_carterae.1